MKNTIARFVFVLFASVTLFGLSSCVQNNLDSTGNKPVISGIGVPNDFNWATIKSAQLTVVPADTYNSQYYYTIAVYGENPLFNPSAALLAKGVSNGSKSYVTKLVLPTSTKVIFVRQIDPSKNEIIQSVAVSADAMVCDFNVKAATVASSMPEITSLRSAKDVVADPTPSGATVLTSASKDVSWTNNTNFVIKAGSSFSGSVVLGTNSALYVEGAFKLAGNKVFTMNSGSKLVIQSGGDIQVSSKQDFQFDANTQIKNFGDFKSTNSLMLTNNSLFYNYGTFDVVKISATNTAEIHNSGTLSSNNAVELTSSAKLFNDGKIDFKNFSTTNAQCTVDNTGTFDVETINIASAPFSNAGVLTVGKTINMASSCTLNNTGAIVTDDLITGSGSKIYNNCHLLVTNDFDATGVTVYLYNQSLLKTSLLLSDGSTFQMEGGAILEAEDAQFSTQRNYLKGTTSGYALARLKNIEPENSKNLSSNITFDGNVEIEYSTITANPQYNIFYIVNGSGIRWAEVGASTTVIAASSCNGTGNIGYVKPVDPVVPPANPAFPIVVNLTTNYSFLMEDNWPQLGDYDMNDLVVDLNISYLQNADNKATEMTVGYTLRAVGASKKIAGAFQLDKVTPSQIASVSFLTPVLTGKVFATEKGGLETGQTKAVIPMFDDAHLLLNPAGATPDLINTIIGNPYYTPVENTIKIVFSSPIDPSTLSIANLNFFIATNSPAPTGKRCEVHLSGFEPTDKADASLFGTADDYSLNGAKYRTASNMIWGLLIPTSFKYASEWKDITTVYPEFTQWCVSGGVDNAFWYKNPSDKSGLLYVKP